MAPPKTMSGARARVGIYDPQTDQVNYVGTFDNVSYGVTYEVQPVFILGRFSAAEIDYTSADVVQVTCSGYRTFGHGWHQDGRLPRLQDLLMSEYIELVIIDRQALALGGEPRVAKIRNCRATSGSGGFSARQLSQMTHTYVGLIVDDESTTNSEHPTAADLP